MKTKEIKVCVKMSGWVYQTIEVPENWIPSNENVDEVLDEFDFAEASDLNDTIDWKLRHADSIQILDDDDDETMWDNDDEGISEEWIAQYKIRVRDSKINSVLDEN